MDNFYPYLCGGTFLVLLSEAKKKYLGENRIRSTSNKKDDSIAEYKLFADLIKVFFLKYKEAKGTTFKSICSKYKTCNLGDSDHLPFTKLKKEDAEEIDERVKKDYPNLLDTMSKFTDKYIAIGDDKVCLHLAKALLELVEKDENIPDEQMFYAQLNGQPISKSELIRLDSICLPALLIGIWHFIILGERKNEKGRETYEKWHKKPEEKRVRWQYIGEFGDNYPYPKKVCTKLDETPTTASEEGTEIAEEKTELQDEDITDTSTVSDKTPFDLLDLEQDNTAEKALPGDNEIKMSSRSEMDSEQVIPIVHPKGYDCCPPQEISEDSNSVVDGNTIVRSKKTELTAEILDIFTKGVRDYNLVNFLLSNELEVPVDIYKFIENMKIAILPYIDKIIKTNMKGKEKLFFDRIGDFMNCIETLIFLIVLFREILLRNITVFSRVKEEVLSEYEENVLSLYNKATDSFREICIDNDLQYDDIVPANGYTVGGFFDYYFDARQYRSDIE